MARKLDGIGRWLRHSPTGRWAAGMIGSCYIRLVNRTTRWTIVDAHHYQEAQSHGAVISAAWHGRLFLSPMWIPRGRRAVAMISNNRDGDLIAALVRWFGVTAVRGSSYDRAKQQDKGGAEAYAGGLEVLKDPSVVLAITPDGPRGPRMRAHRGAAQLAITAGVPIQPIAFSVRRGKVLRNWDRFLLPWPFNRGVQIFGAPLMPPECDDPEAIENLRKALEDSLTDLAARADEMMGQSAILPEPPEQSAA
ncbi:MAG: lysophospholipid acyltransferase family protein [Pseudomonadota bacterium]